MSKTLFSVQLDTALAGGYSHERDYDGVIDTSERMYVNKYTIVFYRKSIFGRPYEDKISLDEVMHIAKRNGFTSSGILTVILETMFGGTIYQYGNYGDYWVVHGRTNGLA